MMKISKPSAITLIALFCLATTIVLAVVLIEKNAPKADISAVYEGTLPGADCAGLKTKVTLYKNGSFKLEETYLATRDGDKTYITKGKYDSIKHKNRDFIRLHQDKDEVYCFLVTEKYILPVGRDLKEIECPFDLKLKKVRR